MNRFFLIKTENVHKLKSRILEYKFSVKEEGDVIMLGTDGLFDNMSEDMLLHHVSKLQVC
jgi:serine/threonine protein phosphatase PrpC